MNSMMFEHAKYIAVSSANIRIFPNVQQFARSFIYRINSKGPRTEP